VPLNEITRFPHAVLEIKLQLEGEDQTPPWVTELLNSGMLLEVHKFSKFIHGCAVLLPDDVREVPYWIDDATLSQSISQSGASSILRPTDQDHDKGKNKTDFFDSLLPHDKGGQAKVKVVADSHQSMASSQPGTARQSTSTEQIRARNIEQQVYDRHGSMEQDEERNCFLNSYCEWASAWQGERITTQKMEPKLFFANERTFIKWMQMAVVLSSISVGVIAFANDESKCWLLSWLVGWFYSIFMSILLKCRCMAFDNNVILCYFSVYRFISVRGDGAFASVPRRDCIRRAAVSVA